ncbi:hypothetical protein Q3G72_007182 [Acer saccharum]|nr:hypothetical protein Q3G72_007182 [Acer saccharum]
MTCGTRWPVVSKHGEVGWVTRQQLPREEGIQFFSFTRWAKILLNYSHFSKEPILGLVYYSGICGREKKRLPRVMTVPGVISELDDDQANSVSSDVQSSVVQDRVIIVANQLPVKAKRRPDNRGWSFSWDEDSLLLQLKDGLPEDMEVIYVGSLKVEVDVNEQDDVSTVLLDSRMLGLEYQSKRGYIGLEYYGRTVGIKIMPVGIHMGQIESVLRLADKEWRVGELKQQFEGKTVLLGVDDMDIFKGVDLKLLAMEHLLKHHPKWQGKAVLVQISNPARGRGRELEEIQAEIQSTCQRINETYGQPGYEPIVFIDRPVSLSERAAYYTIAECVVVTAVRDGMNLTPYEYVVCRQGVTGSEFSSESSGPKKSMLVVSEFIGCSPSLSGAIRVNPWNTEATAEAMNESISMAEPEKQLRHEKHYRYVSTHDVAYWSRSFFQDMERTCKDHFRRRCWGIGLSFGFRVVALDPNFRKLSVDATVNAYVKSKNRAILFDYDGTVMSQTAINRAPSHEVISIINTLCDDVKNTVFVVSGRGRDSLGKWFSPCKKLGIAAEHGYFMRWSADEEWETCGQSVDFGWIQIAEPVMKLYTEATDGSYIETKESALVWHHRDADPGFGSSQAKEMLDHLESVLANEPVAVKSGQFIVEVKPQGVSKGLVVEKIFSSMSEKGKRPDFVVCIGDDRSDEDMFEIIGNAISSGILASNSSVFACTVGQKPSKAKYYLDDPSDVVMMLDALADASDPPTSDDDETNSS